MVLSPRQRTFAFLAALIFLAYAATALESSHRGDQNGDQSIHTSLSNATTPEHAAPASLPDLPTSGTSAHTVQSNGSRTSNRNSGNGNGGFVYHSNGIPFGFEAWFETQRVALDVFYGGRYLLTALAEHNNGEITLLQPGEVANRIPGVLDVELMASLLGEAMDTNADRVCGTERQPLCGRVDTDSVALIFDETRIRADLFVHRSLLAAQKEADPRYLPDGTQQRPTLVQNLSSLYTNDDNNNERFSLFGTTRAGRNGHYLFGDWVSTSEQDLSVDQLGYRHHLRDHLVTVGLFETNADMLRGMRRDMLAGAAVERSMLRRTDLDSILSTPIDLFLPVRSRVDIFRDGRLIASTFYEAGNQRIDTSRLPTGAYLIDIVTTDNAGNFSSEQQLFVKSSLLAPPGQSLWFAEMGKVHRRTATDLWPEELDVLLARGGYRWRQISWLGLGVAGAATEEQALGELSANLLLDRFEAGGEVYHSSAGGWGLGARAVSRLGRHTFSLNSRRSRADPEPGPDEEPYRLIDDSRWVHSAQWISRVSQQGNLSVTASYRGGEVTNNRRSVTARYIHNIPLASANSLTLGAELGNVDGDYRASLSAQWRGGTRQLRHSAQLRWSGSELNGERDGLSANASSRWYDGDRWRDDVNAGIAAQIDEATFGITADANHESEFGRGRAAVSHTRRNAFDSTQYLVGYDISLLAGEDWLPRPGGGPRRGEAGAILDLRDAPGSHVDVYANGQRQFTARGGRQVPLTLSAYQEHSISVIDRGTDLVSVDSEPRRLVLYPGDVGTLRWSMQRIHIIVGRLFRFQEFCSEVTDACHSLRLPLANTRVEGLEGFVFTDADGFFQGEVAQDRTLLNARIGEHTCEIDIGGLAVIEGVIRAPAMICDDVSGAVNPVR
ncbi:MAG: TcfC E-set like domain-containing protein [Alcanivoracaceae bacterium]